MYKFWNVCPTTSRAGYLVPAPRYLNCKSPPSYVPNPYSFLKTQFRNHLLYANISYPFLQLPSGILCCIQYFPRKHFIVFLFLYYIAIQFISLILCVSSALRQMLVLEKFLSKWMNKYLNEGIQLFVNYHTAFMTSGINSWSLRKDKR